jgi:GNAT superfamily N-acetyltransferase
MKIRRATHDHASALASLSAQLGYPSAKGAIRQRLLAIDRRNDQEVLVAEVDGTVVGWVHVFRAERIVADSFAEVGGLVVDGERRGRGVGSTLLRAAEAWAHERGLPLMRIRSNVVRDEAHEFYVKRGYTGSKQQAVFDKPLDRVANPDHVIASAGSRSDSIIRAEGESRVPRRRKERPS